MSRSPNEKRLPISYVSRERLAMTDDQDSNEGHSRYEPQNSPAFVGPSADQQLLVASTVLDDIEGMRISMANRLLALTAEPMEGEKGGSFGSGFHPSDPAVRQLSSLVEVLEQIEHGAILDLQRTFRKHPLAPWMKSIPGIGEKQGARLLAAIGDPAARPNVAKLWAYCGYHVLPADQAHSATQSSSVGEDPIGHTTPDPHSYAADGTLSIDLSDPGHETHEVHVSFAGVAPKRRKGQRANWNTVARTRAYLVAKQCMMQVGNDRTPRSPYRDTYEKRRIHTEVSHPEWTDLHSHNDALRVTAKEILKDLWAEARRLQESDAL